jgi:LCP family protein required for cell wall assembly
MRRKQKHLFPNKQPLDMNEAGHALIRRGRRRPAEAAAEDTAAASRKPRRSWFKRIVLLLVALVLLAGLWVGGKFVINGVKIFGWDGFVSLLTTRKLEGENEGRVNILLAGNSADDPGHEGANLTDSIMLLSINTQERKGYVMSIPRDLYVDIPNNGYAKINEVYQDGLNATKDMPGQENGGMELLKQVVSNELGIDVHYSALINYTALQQAVDAVDGIAITVDSTDERGLFDPSPDLGDQYKPLVDLPNGPVHLDGRQALNLARARGHGDGAYGYDAGDFVRTQHQRQILIGLRDRAMSAGTLSNPFKLGQLVDSFGDNVETDLELGEFRRLYVLTKPIPSGQLVSAGLNGGNDADSLLKPYTTEKGQYTLIPRAGRDDYSEIRAYMQELEAKN